MFEHYIEKKVNLVPIQSDWYKLCSRTVLMVNILTLNIFVCFGFCGGNLNIHATANFGCGKIIFVFVFRDRRIGSPATNSSKESTRLYEVQHLRNYETRINYLRKFVPIRTS